MGWIEQGMERLWRLFPFSVHYKKRYLAVTVRLSLI